MRSEAKNPKEYLASLPEDRKKVFTALRNEVLKNLPKGFCEVMYYGMLGYVVPHSIYPKGYHVDPKQPLPFMGLASQKNFIAVYHMGIYSDPKILKWFTDAFKKQVKSKLDMGKSCIRFKNPEHIPLKLIGELSAKMTTKDWISTYENHLKK